MKKVQKIAVTTLEELKSALKSNRNVVLKFYSKRCGPCKLYDRIIEDYESDQDITLCSVDAEKSGELREKFNVVSVPHSLILNEDCTVKDEKLGLLNNKDFDAFLKKNFE